MMHDDDTLLPDDETSEEDAPLAGDGISLDDDTEVGIVPDEDEDLDDLGMKVEGEEDEEAL